MNTTLSKRLLHVPHSMCDTFEERAVDMDIVLPDYIPEISAVLKCSLRPFITSRSQNGDRCTVDGTSEVRILYVDEDRKTVHGYVATQPFHVSFPCENAIHNFVTAKTDYVNCRALSSRRLDIHGAFRVFLRAVGVEEIGVYAPSVQQNVFCDTKTIQCMLPVFETEKSIVIEERIDCGTSVDRFAFADAAVVSVDVKPLVNKMIVKGTLRAKLVCSNGESHPSMIQEIPFSQIVDADGASDRWRCCADVQVGEMDVHLQTSDNNVPILIMHAKLRICVRCYDTAEETVVMDAYSIHAPLLCEMTPIRYMPVSDVKFACQTFSAQTDLPDRVADVLQLWGEVKSCERHENEWKLCIVLSMIARDDDGSLAYYERTVDVNDMRNAPDTATMFRLVWIEGAVIGHTLRMQMELESCNDSLVTQTESVVCDTVEEDKSPYVKSNAAIRIVYADVGESVWEIAKANHACVEDILAENELSDMVITSPTMLMIPMM